jgi:predicted DNA-binding transcriptional regulator YafY
MLLQRQPNQKAADLAEKLGVSVRTLHRYFTKLDEMGIPVYTERGPHGGFSLVSGYKMPPLVFTPEEATAVTLGTSLVEEIGGSLYREAALGALAKLENVLPDEQRQEIGWARRSLVVTGLQRAELNALIPTLEKLRKAVRELRTVNMVYRSSSRIEPQPRDLDPYALVHRWGFWYVIGYCHLRQQMRSFRVDRIVELSLSSQVFQVPADFNIQAYLITELRDQQRLQVQMRFNPQAANVALANRLYWETAEEQPDGSVIVTLLAPDLGWAASTVLAYGPIVTVLEPPELRQMVGEWAKSISKLYEL